MNRRLSPVFCLDCGRSVPRAALRCLWCRAPSPLRPLRLLPAARRPRRAEAAMPQSMPLVREQAGA